MVVRAVAGIGVVLALAACFVDAGSPSMTAGATSTGAPTTTGASTDESGTATSDDASTSATTSTSTATSTATSTTSSTSTSTTSSTTGDPSGPTTDDPICALPGEACSDDASCCGECGQCSKQGVCVAVDALCGECRVCSPEATCGLAPEKSECGAPLDCGAVVWGLNSGTCYASQGVFPGRCDAGGVCLPPSPDLECTLLGQAIASCPECLRDDANCPKGAAAASITVDAVCYTDGRTCAEACDGDDHIQIYECDDDGSCDPASSQSCSPYACDGGVCLDSCSSDLQCASLKNCSEGFCK